MSGRRSGSLPYSVTESKAVDRRLAGMPSDSSLKRLLVRNGSPSPANMRVGILALALEREGAGGVGIAARHVVQHQPFEDLAVILVLRQADLANRRAGKRLGGQGGADFLVADLDHVLVAGIGLAHLRPLGQQLAGGRVEAGLALIGQPQHRSPGAVALCVVFLQHARGLAQLLQLARQRGLLARELLVAANGVADFSQVARARRRHHRRLVGAVAHAHDAARCRP